MYRLIATPHFARAVRRFQRQHPELRERLSHVLDDLRTDPRQAHLRLHPLHGELEGRHAVSITQAYRIVLVLRITEREIELLDIGSHDVYR